MFQEVGNFAAAEFVAVAVLIVPSAIILKFRVVGIHRMGPKYTCFAICLAALKSTYLKRLLQHSDIAKSNFYLFNIVTKQVWHQQLMTATDSCTPILLLKEHFRSFPNLLVM